LAGLLVLARTDLSADIFQRRRKVVVLRKPIAKKVYRCKYCKVAVISRTDFRAILGKEHAKHCPRHKKG
jgi:hypothetical protein